MRVSDLQVTDKADRVRASATVRWEDNDRPDREIYFETERRFGSDLSANPNAFLLATLIPAAINGEARVHIDGALCPRLQEGMLTAIRLLSHWYELKVQPSFAVESAAGFEARAPAAGAQAASTMSGGVDSLATLQRNREQLPLEHPLSIRTCFLAYGIDVGGYESMAGSLEHFEHVRRTLEPLAQHANVDLVPVYTNMRHLDDSDLVFASCWFGAAIAALGHAFSARVSTMFVPSGNSISEQAPQGSHPLLDGHYSSADLGVLHDGFGLSRLEKVGRVAAWPEALASLRSCYAPFRDAEVLNCGRCEKCLRTMTGLLAHGKLGVAHTFPLDDIQVGHIDSLLTRAPPFKPENIEEFLRELRPILTDHSVEMWREMCEPLASRGRGELAAAIANKVASYCCYRDAALAETSFRSSPLRASLRRATLVVAQIDERFLGGRLRLAYRRRQGTA